jgi:hypothetical protein
MAELAAITQRGEAQRAAAESDRAALLQASADRVARAGERSADRVAALRERAALIMSTLPEGVPDATVDSLLDMTRQIAQASDPQALGSVVGRLATAADAAASTARRRAFVQGEAAAVLAMLAGLESPDANDLRARAEAALESGQDWNPELRGQARAEAARLDAVAERLQVASALAESLIALGYEVGPGFERVLAGKGGAYAYRGRWSEHALRVRVDGDAGRVAMEVVRRVGDETAVSAAGTSADVLRDEEVETEFCATLEPVLSMAAGLGIDVEIDRRSDPGHKPVRRVTDAVPAEATRMRRRAEEADKEMRVDE